MKNIQIKIVYLFLIPILYSSVIIAQTYDGLKILNPNQSWSKTAGKFESIKMTMTPSYAYTNIDIEFEVSAQNTSLSSSPDSLEAEYKFSLPNGAILHEAWLWMNNVPIPAIIYERQKAKMIYESLVSRKVDPIIVYDNGDNTYEARVYPIFNPNNRKFKLSYMVPNIFTPKYIEVPLNFNMFRSDISTAPPTIQLTVKTNTAIGAPLYNLIGGSFTINANTYTTSIAANSSNIQENNSLYFNNSNVISNSFVTEPSVGNEGFYQLLLKPPLSSVGQKYVFVIDYKTNITNFSSILSSLKSKVLHHLSDSDKFNIIYVNGNNIVKASNTWINCDNTAIYNAFNAIPSNINNSSSKCIEALQNAVSFINNNGSDGIIYMISNADLISNSISLNNQLINSLQVSMNANYPIHVLDFNNYSYNYWWVNNSTYYNNQYYFENLSLLTSGSYSSLLNAGYSYSYYSPQYAFNNILNTSFEGIKKRFDYSSISKNYSGVLHSEYKTTSSIMLPIGNTYIEFGRYINLQNLDVNFNYGLNGQNFSNSQSLTPIISTDTFIKKMWAYQYIKDLSNNNTNNVYTNTIINASKDYKVLSEYTAFLALEPDTVTGTISNLPLETIQPIDKKLSIDIKIYPNPFSVYQTIAMDIPENFNNKNYNIEVLDITGKIIKRIQGNTLNKKTISFNWTDDMQISNGIYFIKIAVDNQYKSFKIIKN